MTIPGLYGLITYILTRPFDFVPALRSIPFLYIFFFLALFGFLVDLAQGRIRWKRAPQLYWVLVLLGWSLVTVLWRARQNLTTSWLQFLIAVSLYFLIAHGVADFRRLSALAGLILLCTMVVSAICVYQGLQPLQCVGFDPAAGEDQLGTPDGRACDSAVACSDDAPEPDWDYRCEKVGLGGTTSIGRGRVRYVGVLHDPNEAALAVSIGVPIAIARFQRRRSLPRLTVMLLAIALAAATVVFSQSRGGQLVFLTVLGVYFVRRYRVKGVLAAALVALPVMLFGGRSGAEAAVSSGDRLSCAYAGIWMFLKSPLTGVGFGQFVEYHDQTAHNSYILAPAELGVLGMILWAMVLWISIKICLPALRMPATAENDEARTWGIGLFASLVGMAVGVGFLSFDYHYVLWTFLGVAGAYSAALRGEQPEWKLRIGRKDVFGVLVANLALMVVVLVYMRLRGP